jgi:hypothetical protein
VDHLSPLFPQLEILELIGQGGMGAVYKARQPGLNRLVALKILSAAVSGDAGFADRFTREAQLLARLQHPRIVAIHDVGVAGSLHYLVMEYVDGPNLRQVQRTGQLAPGQALRIVPEICEALQFAHDRGVVHRDIKPENVLLDRDGHVKITDFGIAKMIGPDADTVALTGGVDVIGTPHYMAPEQIERPLDVDHRADIYSLGVVFYELLTGELPLGRFAAPSQRVQVDVRLDDVVLRALEKEPARRYQQVSEVKTRVDSIASSAPTLSQSFPRPVVQPLAQPRDAGRKPINALLPIVLYMLPALSLWMVQRALWFADAFSSGPGLFGHLFGPIYIPGPMTRQAGGPMGGFSPFFLHMLALSAAYASWALVHHACWKALPERYRGTTPANAVGLLFVPVFNFYWAFVSLGRLASGFEAWGKDHPEHSIRQARALAMGKAAAFVASWTVGWASSRVLSQEPYLGGFRITGIVVIIDAVLFALYYRAVVRNANEVIAVQGVDSANTFPS